MHIAFAASEGVPFSKTGGLADVVGALPRALAALGHQVSVYLPRYK
ncbi:MAG: glycogen/starch synthase, partial [Candidatus Sulfotelmatobacter sp.]